ncbi:MAG: hypothetical protein K9W43_07170 [Candidatus Thorarchaeota archaeon]|nr:hypothetical protein [Candidatus Thorarchaeota archaeon]
MNISAKLFFRAGVILLFIIVFIQLVIIGLQSAPSDQTLLVNVIFIFLTVIEMPTINMIVLGYYTERYNEEGSIREPRSELGTGLVIIGLAGIILLIIFWNSVIDLVTPKTLVNMAIGHYLFGIFYAGVTILGFRKGLKLRLEPTSPVE